MTLTAATAVATSQLFQRVLCNLVIFSTLGMVFKCRLLPFISCYVISKAVRNMPVWHALQFDDWLSLYKRTGPTFGTGSNGPTVRPFGRTVRPFGRTVRPYSHPGNYFDERPKTSNCQKIARMDPKNFANSTSSKMEKKWNEIDKKHCRN